MPTDSANPRFDHLRDQIAADLKPVKPIAPAWRRALFLLALQVVGVGCLAATAAIRADLPAGSMVIWGPSLVCLGLSYLIVLLALRGAIPGHGPTRVAVIGLAVLAIGAHVAMSLLAHQADPDPAAEGGLITHCLGIEIAMALPLLLLVFALLARGLPTQLAPALGLAGIGCALAADTIWHLVCPESHPDHVLLGHSLAIAVVTGIGLTLGVVIEAWRRRSS